MKLKLPKPIKDTIALVIRADVGVQASSLAFTTVLSIAPLLAVLFYVFKLVGGFEIAYEKLVPFLIANLSEGTGEVVAATLAQFIKTVHAKTVGWVGIAGLFFTAIMTYLTVAKAFVAIWEAQGKQKFWNKLLRAALLISLGPVLAAASIAITTLIASQIKVVPFSGYFVAILLNLLLYAMVYTLLAPVRIRILTALAGSMLPAILWELAKSGYAIYTKKIVSYSKFYGSLAAIPMFLFWVYIAWYITLLGAAWVRTLDESRKTSG